MTEPLSSCYTFLGWSDGYGSACRKDVFAVCSDSYEAVYIETVPQLQIPTLQINTGGKDITSNVDYISATVSTNGCEDAHKITKAKARIRGRGNAAWDTFKNYKPSYKLNFNEQISLFGLGGADKDWLLISTVTDKSFLRNYAIQRLGHLLSGNEWSPSCMFIEVYLNGDYRGVYLLCEQIEANGHKLDLDDEKEEADKDYLLELDHRASWKGDDPLTYFEIPGGQQPFVIQSTVNSAKERTFIRKEVLNLHNALMSVNEKEIRALCDMGALVDNYIIQEFGHNRDVGFASFYFYRKDGLFYFGPPWDFDLGLGNDRDYPNALNEIYSNGGRGNHWFESLYKQVWFRRLVKKRMAEIEPMILTVEGEVRMMGQALEGAAQRNYQRFPVLGSPVFLEPAETAAFTSYEQHVSYLCDWMQKRWQFLKKTIR